MASPGEDKEQALPLDPESRLLLFFPLKEKYEELSFAFLMGHDGMIAQLFRSQLLRRSPSLCYTIGR